MNSKNWRSSQDQVFEFGCAASIGFSIVALTAPLYIQGWQRLLLIVGVNALVIFISSIIRRRNANTVEKLFYTRIGQASQIVENILNSKQIPFNKQKQGRKMYFYIEKDEFKIIIRPVAFNNERYSSKHNGTASNIKIHSSIPENKPLVQSLKLKLDDGFTPKGL